MILMILINNTIDIKHNHTNDICCKDFLKKVSEITSLEELTPLLSSNCFFPTGLDSNLILKFETQLYAE